MRKINFQEVEFKNFLSFGNNWQKFNFDNGLCIIQGQIVESGKSNGAGKSSLTELIPFSLFGKTIKKVKKDEIINWYNGKNCEVRLKFDVDGVPHEIRRGIKPNKLEVLVDGVQLPKPAKVTDFQLQIEEDIIGMDFQTFQNLIYFSPNNTISIINAGKPEKRKFLESLFDLSIYSNMLKTVNLKLKTNDEKGMEFQIVLDSQIREKARYEEEINNAVMPDLRKHQIKIKGLLMQVEEKEKKTFDVHDEDRVREEEFIERCKETLHEWEKKEQKSHSQINLHETIIKSLDDVEEIKKKRTEISSQILDIELKDFCKLTEDDLADDIQKKELMKDDIKGVVEEIQEVDKEIAVVDANLQRTRTQINEPDMQGGQRCMACHQLISKEHIAKHTKELQKFEKICLDDLEVIQNKRDVLSEKKEELYEKVKDESERIKEILGDIEIAEESRKTLTQLRLRLEDLADTEEAEDAIVGGNKVIEAEKKNISEAVGKIHLCEIDIDLAKDRWQKVFDQLANKNMHENELDILKSELKSATEAYDEMQELADKINKEIEGKHGLIYSTEMAIEANTKHIEGCNIMTDYLNYIKVALKDENVKRYAISSLIPYLNQQANLYLAESGFPYIVSIDSWLDVTIRGLGVEEVSYGSLSGGETKCIDMAVQLACNDIASMMAKVSLNLMVLDEVLDSSVDSLGVQSLLNIIRVRQTSTNGSVYVITHRNEIDEFTFDSIVRIINEDKFSKVEVE